MKNHITLITLAIAAFVFVACDGKVKKTTTSKETSIETTIASEIDEQNTHGWGEFFGTISFATDQTWAIQGKGIKQVWSDAVQATNCNKSSFNGGNVEIGQMLVFNADCRSNPDYKGDLFSWEAVAQYGDVLCPHPWRVPTVQDFIDLDIALGGDGETGAIDWRRYTATSGVDEQFWGGEYGGGCTIDGVLYSQGEHGYYWSQSQQINSSMCGHYLYLSSSGHIYPQNWYSKNSGFALRCVR